MNLLDSILTAKGGGAVSQLAKQFGLPEDQTASAIQNLVPALAGGVLHAVLRLPRGVPEVRLLGRAAEGVPLRGGPARHRQAGK